MAYTFRQQLADQAAATRMDRLDRLYTQHALNPQGIVTGRTPGGGAVIRSGYTDIYADSLGGSLAIGTLATTQKTSGGRYTVKGITGTRGL
jgi:hypothetical protein